MNPLFLSIIIPVEGRTKYLLEALNWLSKQTYSDFEVIISSSLPFSVPYSFVRVVMDKKLSGDVAAKRNKILKFGKGEIFVFNDDDVFAPKNYLEKIIRKFKDKKILAACGPLLTPVNDSFWQKGSGAVWESYLGSLGAGIYRSRKQPARIVYDYPAANLIVRREVFEAVGGFEKGLYPGEDTKLCLLIFNKYQKGVVYDPDLFVYHHRKPLFRPHLKQIGRYGHQRGWFSLSYPTTSFKIQYFLPSFLLLYLLGLFMVALFGSWFLKLKLGWIIFLPLLFYGLLVVLEGAVITYRRGFPLSILAILGIVATHLYYGYQFARSFIRKIIQKIGKALKNGEKL